MSENKEVKEWHNEAAKNMVRLFCGLEEEIYTIAQLIANAEPQPTYAGSEQVKAAFNGLLVDSLNDTPIVSGKALRLVLDHFKTSLARIAELEAELAQVRKEQG